MAMVIPAPVRTSNPTDKVKPQPTRRSVYKRIRFKTWKPSKDSPPDRFHEIIQWQPPPTAEENSQKRQETHWKTSGSRRGSPAKIKNAIHSPSPLQRLPVNGTRMDPFTSLPIKSGGCVPSTVDYFLVLCTAGSRPKEVALDDHVNPHISMLFPFALQHAVLLESMVAVCRASVLISQGKPALEDQAFIYHRGQAISGLTSKLGSKQCADDVALLSVAMLLTLEYLMGNDAGVAAHLAGLKQMSDMRSDLNKDTPWNRFVLGGIEVYKSLGSFVTGQPPPIPSDSHGFIREAFAELSLDKPTLYPTLPFSPDLCTIISRLPTGVSELCLSGRISTQLTYILASVAATNSLSTAPFRDPPKLNSEIQVLLSALQRLSLMPISPIEKCVYCGLVAYCFQLRRVGTLNLLHDPQLQTFVKLIPFHEKPDSGREQKCLVWISMSVAGALALRPIAMPGAHLVLEHAFELYPAFCTKWDQLEALLRTFFWTDTISEHWKKTWEAGMARRRQMAARGEQHHQGWAHNHVVAVTDTDMPGEDADMQGHEQIEAHIRGMPAAMMEMMEASKCPFNARIMNEVAVQRSR